MQRPVDDTLRRFADRHGYRTRWLAPFDPPLGSEQSAVIVPCRRGAWLWDAVGALGFDIPWPRRNRAAKAAQVKALPGVSRVRWDDPEEPDGGIDGCVAWEAWSEVHERFLRPLRRPRLSAEERERRRRDVKRAAAARAASRLGSTGQGSGGGSPERN